MGLHRTHIEPDIKLFSLSSAVGGEDEFGRGLVIAGRDDAHGCGVARAGCDLFAVGNGEVLSQARIDKVVAGSKGGDLSGLCHRLAVFIEETTLAEV